MFMIKNQKDNDISQKDNDIRIEEKLTEKDIQDLFNKYKQAMDYLEDK